MEPLGRRTGVCASQEPARAEDEDVTLMLIAVMIRQKVVNGQTHDDTALVHLHWNRNKPLPHPIAPWSPNKYTQHGACV